ncbi:MAG: BrnA antitoxin family protein [Proteobacteria bacterium]|nr:BrnA antitoxin family protein [Pseudomonadota bacterium]
MAGNKRSSQTASADADDAPTLTKAFFEAADLYKGTLLVQRGRPKVANPKKALTIRYDADVIDAFRALGSGWQTRMNDALRKSLKLPPR